MKKIYFYSLMIIYIILVLFDFNLTYINTPDLLMEANPLVANFGLGWRALIIVNIVGFILIFWMAYYSTFKYKTKYTEQTKFTAYCSQIVYDRPDMFWKGIIPKHITPYIAALGFAFPYAVIIGRLILVIEWLCFTYNINIVNYYFSFCSIYFIDRIDVFIGVVIQFMLIIYWFYYEFKKQLNRI